jgi:hypothetical protein
MIYGKKGFDYWIEYNKKKKDETELKIEKNEYDYSALHNQSVGTDNKSVKKTKKSRKHITHPDDDKNPPLLTNYGDKKDKRKSEATIVGLYNLFDAYKKKIAELEKQKQEVIDLMAIYQLRLDTYRRIIGAKWATFTEENGLYTFQDSCTFDLLTQEFRFPAKDIQEEFEVRLVAIPESSLSNQADEVMLHLNLCDVIPDQDARFQLELKDVFASDSWKLDKTLIRDQDSLSVLQFFEALQDKKLPFTIVARGQGIGQWNGSRTVKNRNPLELTAYPNAEARMDSSFVRLRSSQVIIHLNRGIKMEVNSFTDPVASSLSISDESIQTLMQKYKLSKNDILSAYRSASILTKLKQELNVLAGLYLDREKAKGVIDRFNKEFAKTKVSIGTTSIKLSDLKL